MSVKRMLPWLALAIAIVASLAPIAHVLELANKMRLAGPLWLGVQQHLYNGWGPFLGGPAEIGGLVFSVALVVVCWPEGRLRRLYFVAALAYAGMLAAFFIFNDCARNRLRARPHRPVHECKCDPATAQEDR